MQFGEIDDVEVRAVAWGDDAAVVESVGSGCSRRLLVDQEFERQPQAGARVASPQGPILRSATPRVDYINPAVQYFCSERQLPP